MQQYLQLPLQYGKGIELLSQVVIVFRHLFDKFAIPQDFLNMLDGFVVDKALEFHGFEAFGFDVDGIDCIVVEEDRTAVIDRFQKGIAKSLQQGWKGNEICV